MDGIKKDHQNLPPVLLVENDKSSVDITRYFLKQVCIVDVAENGEAALALVQQKFYPLILMDINLGDGVSGIEVSREIRKLNGYESTAIVALTAFAAPNDKNNFLAEGMTHYLAKPIDKASLVNLVKSILDSAVNP